MPDDGARNPSPGLRMESADEPGCTSGSPLARYATWEPRWGKTSEAVTGVLREAILDGVLGPSTWLRESEIARELSVSRTPVREALRRLAAEGLVVLTANQGAVVARITLDDILEIYTVRENLEGLAARLAARHRSEEQLGDLKRVLNDMRRAAASQSNPRELARLNLDFHRVIREASSNRLLDRFLTQIEHSVRRFGRTTYEIPEWVERSLEEHARMLRAIEERDDDLAERLASEHMRNARRLRIEMLLD